LALKASVKYAITFAALLVAAGLWLLNNFETDVTQKPQNTELAHAVNECDAITEKAAMNLVAVVDFQKLEIAGRKANVFKTCMKDRAYIENPAWTKYAAPIAMQKAKTENTSKDEAFENLRRAKMMVTMTSQDEPLYWIKVNE
jgi:hypothetical protein